MLSFEQNNSPIEMIATPRWRVVQRFHCRVHLEAAEEEEAESERASERATLLRVLTVRHSVQSQRRWHQDANLATLFCMAI